MPYTNETPIYVHAKLMIVDDEILRVGSSNLNNRSLGLDSECDTVLDATRPHNAGRGFEDRIRAIRISLLAEHCGEDEATMEAALEEHGTMQKAIAALGSSGRRQLRPYVPPTKTQFEEWLAESAMLDPEKPSGILKPFARGGLFGKEGRLRNLRDKVKRKLLK